jgi:hypothetical protein
VRNKASPYSLAQNNYNIHAKHITKPSHQQKPRERKALLRGTAKSRATKLASRLWFAFAYRASARSSECATQSIVAPLLCSSCPTHSPRCRATQRRSACPHHSNAISYPSSANVGSFIPTQTLNPFSRSIQNFTQSKKHYLPHKDRLTGLRLTYSTAL